MKPGFTNAPFISVCLVVTLISFGAMEVWATEPPSFDAFLEEKGLTPIFESTPLLKAMANRWEAVAESGFFLYGFIAYREKNKRVKPSVLDSFCRMALLRNKMRSLETEIIIRNKDELLVKEVLKIAVAEGQVKNYKRLGQVRRDGWSACACRLRPEDISLPDVAPNLDKYLARASYNLAKSCLEREDKRTALEWFKQTRTTREVYDNSLAFLVVLIHGLDPDLSARIEERFLRLDRIDDPQALAYLARFRIANEEFKPAIATCQRCLEIQPDEGECLYLLGQAEDAQTRAGLGFEAFFSE